MEENNIDINNVVCHAPYIVNLGNASDPEKYKFSKEFIKKELQRCDEMGITKMVLHPGNATGGLTKQEGLDNIINAINTILDGSSKCKILLETMAGKGTECGNSKEEIAYMINNINKKDQIGISLDTCHLSDSGVDVTNLDTYLDELEKIMSYKIKRKTTKRAKSPKLPLRAPVFAPNPYDLKEARRSFLRPRRISCSPRQRPPR